MDLVAGECSYRLYVRRHDGLSNGRNLPLQHGPPINLHLCFLDVGNQHYRMARLDVLHVLYGGDHGLQSKKLVFDVFSPFSL